MYREYVEPVCFFLSDAAQPRFFVRCLFTLRITWPGFDKISAELMLKLFIVVIGGTVWLNIKKFFCSFLLLLQCSLFTVLFLDLRAWDTDFRALFQTVMRFLFCHRFIRSAHASLTAAYHISAEYCVFRGKEVRYIMDSQNRALAEKYKNELIAYSLRHNEVASELRRKALEKEPALAPVLFSGVDYLMSADTAAYTDIGGLIVKISLAGRGTPVIGAAVSLVRDDFTLQQISDTSGRTAVMAVPCPKRTDENVCGCYDLQVSVKDYCRLAFYNVPVFAGCVSVFPIELYPVTVDRGVSFNLDNC